MDALHHGAAPDPDAAVPAVDLPSLGAAGAAPAGLSPPEVDAPPPMGVGERRGMDQGANGTDCAGEPAADQHGDETLRTELAMAGFALATVSDGAGGAAYLLSRRTSHKLPPDRPQPQPIAPAEAAR